jgi:osmotically-inducible protein OsmY
MMLKTADTPRLIPFLIAGLLCTLSHVAHAQQFGTNQGNQGTITSGTNMGTSQGTNTQSGGGTASDAGLNLEGPVVSEDAAEAIERQASGFVGADQAGADFAGVLGAGQNANTQSNRQFTTRTPGQNINQGTQRQPLYRTFGPNNIPYRSPHKIAFQVNRPRERSVDLSLRRNVRILSSRRPQFRNVQFEVSGEKTVTLRGFVANERDLKMAMLYVKMEPGVDRVINELEVSYARSAPQTPPAPPTPSASQ